MTDFQSEIEALKKNVEVLKRDVVTLKEDVKTLQQASLMVLGFAVASSSVLAFVAYKVGTLL